MVWIRKDLHDADLWQACRATSVEFVSSEFSLDYLG